MNIKLVGIIIVFILYIITINTKHIFLRYLCIFYIIHSRNDVIGREISYYGHENKPYTPYSKHIRKIGLKIRNINEMKQDNIFIEYKEIINIEKERVLNSYIAQLKHKHRINIIVDTYVLRISSNPHRLLCHFDCRTSNLFMLYGKKQILTFYLNDYNFQEQKDFMIKVKNKMMHDLIDYLKQNQIQYEYNIIYPGNHITLLPFQYHYVENLGNTKFTILLNMDNNDLNHCHCDSSFLKHWPEASWYRNS